MALPKTAWNRSTQREYLDSHSEQPSCALLVRLLRLRLGLAFALRPTPQRRNLI